MSYQVDSYGNAYFPAGVSVASIPATTGTQNKVLVPGPGGRISSASIAQLITQSGGNLVSSVYGRTGAVVARQGDYNTDLVTEGQALYFSDGRARKAISLTTFNTSGPATYDSTTGILNIPQYGSGIVGNYVPVTRTITINGQTADLSANRIFSIDSMVYPSAGIPLSNGTSWGTSIVNNSANWNTAFGWGDHSVEGYLTSFTETDPTVASHIKAITTTNIANWNSAHSWGNHALAGYLTSFTETDPIWTSEKINYYTKLQADARYLQSYTETDPVWTSEKVNYYTKTAADARYLQSYTETDPVWNSEKANYALKTYVDTSISNLIDAAPTALDTLNELAAALGDDANFSTSITTLIGTKEPAITPGTTAQYWRGDKTWQTLPIYTLSGLGGVPTSRTLTINGTSYDLSADRSWSITSMIYPSAGIAVSTGTAWGTSITDNSSNWNTAYGWGNHASVGYLTSITSLQVTNALGYIPYNSSNPAGYTSNTGTVTGTGTTNYLSKWTGSTSIGNSILYDNGSAIGINTASPFESSAFKLDVNGGLIIKNTSGVPAQLILIDSNPATGGNNGFVQLVAGGNTATAFGQWQTYYGTSIASGTLRLQPAGGVVLVGSSTAITGAGLLQVAGDVNITGTFRVNGVAISSGTTLNGTGFVKVSGTTVSYDNNTYLTSLPSHNHDGRYIRLDTVNEQDGIVAHFRPTTSGGYTMMKFESKVNQTSDYGWILMQDDSANTNGAPTTEDIRMTIGVFNDFQGPGVHSDELWFQGGARLVQNVGSWDSEYNTIIGTPAAKTNGTTYEWRINNSSVMAISFGGVLSVGGNTVYHAGNLTNLNQLTNGPGYLTSITSTQVTNALGYIPYNSTNPSGYITGYTETDTLSSVTGRGASTSTAITINGIDSALKVQHDGTSTAWRGRIGSFNASADKSSFLGNYTGRPGVFGHNNSLSAWAELYVNTLGVYGQGTLYLSWFTYVKANGGDTDYAIWHAGNLTNLNQLSNGPGYITSSATSLTLTGNLTVSSGNATGGGIILADDGDIVDLNDAYCSMRFSAGVRIFSANRGGTPVITLSNTGAISGSSVAAGNITTGVNGSHIVQRDANGYIYANHINFNTTETENPTISSFITSNGDGWSRKSTLAHVKNSIRGIADGTWSINIAGSATDSSTDFLHSNRDFPSGTLIQTNINYAVEYGDPWVLEIRGFGYNGAPPFDIQLAGYIYYNTIINQGGYSNGTNISGLRAINYNGNLCFWFPYQGYWQGYNVKVYVPYGGRQSNRVTSISNTGQPTTAKQVDFNLVQSLHSSNYNSYSPTLTGGNASGTWGINITGNSSNITAHTINQSVGTGNTPTFAGAILGCGVSTGRGVYGPATLNLILTSSSAGSDGVCGIDFRSGNNYPSDGASIYYENSQTGSGEVSRLVIRVENDLNDSILMRAGYHVYNARTIDMAGQGADNPVFRWQYLDSNRMSLDSSGNLVCSGDITGYGSPSDSRLKTIKETVQDPIDKIMKISGYRFDWNDINTTLNIKEDVGVIAQEIAEVLPELTRTNENGYMSVRYQGLTALLIEGMKEQQLQIEELKKEIKELKNK